MVNRCSNTVKMLSWELNLQSCPTLELLVLCAILYTSENNFGTMVHAYRYNCDRECENTPHVYANCDTLIPVAIVIYCCTNEYYVINNNNTFNYLFTTTNILIFNNTLFRYILVLVRNTTMFNTSGFPSSCGCTDMKALKTLDTVSQCLFILLFILSLASKKSRKTTETF